MKKFSKQNPDIESTMMTHLIGDFTSFGILDNDYEFFLNERSKMLSKEIKRRIIPQETDKNAIPRGNNGRIKLIISCHMIITTTVKAIQIGYKMYTFIT